MPTCTHFLTTRAYWLAAATVEKQMTAAGLRPGLIDALGQRFFGAGGGDLDDSGGGVNSPEFSRSSIPTEMRPDDADLLVRGMKALQAAAKALDLPAELLPTSQPGQNLYQGGAPPGDAMGAAQTRLVHRSIGDSEVDLKRRDLGHRVMGAPFNAADPLVPDVLIIGGAAAGLAAAACLMHAGVHNIIVLEKGARPGDNWKRRYDRLHLHDIIDECHLPYMAMPDNFPTFPTRIQFGNYLHAYQIALGIPLHVQCTVKKVAKNATGIS